MKNRSRQIFESERDKRKRRNGLIVIAALLAVCVVAVIISLTVKYAPPALDSSRVKGAPTVDGSYLYKEVKSDFDYTLYMAANLYRQADGSVNIYLTNPPSNNVSLMCEITDLTTQEVYYKSGRIEPGEYIENLPADHEFDNTVHNVMVKVYAFEPDTYESAGTTELKLVLQPW